MRSQVRVDNQLIIDSQVQGNQILIIGQVRVDNQHKDLRDLLVHQKESGDNPDFFIFESSYLIYN